MSHNHHRCTLRDMNISGNLQFYFEYLKYVNVEWRIDSKALGFSFSIFGFSLLVFVAILFRFYCFWFCYFGASDLWHADDVMWLFLCWFIVYLCVSVFVCVCIVALMPHSKRRFSLFYHIFARQKCSSNWVLLCLSIQADGACRATLITAIIN